MQTLHQFQVLFDGYLAENRLSRQPAELYAPVNYMLDLSAKRLRPMALMLGYHLYADDVEKALPAAFAIEIFHNFTLVHDDIMDAAPLRRGQPTVHLAYDTNTAILSGDAMLVLAYDFLLKIEDANLLQPVLDTFTKTATQVCEGQQMDMNFEKESAVAIPDYLKMIELKTSVLLACAIKIGAFLGGASARDADSLYDFGKYIGIAFQLQDDVLDTYGEPGKFGKKQGGDIVQNKKTFLYLKALELAEGIQKDRLKDLYSQNCNVDEKEKIRMVKRIFDLLGVKNLATACMESYRKKAQEQLSGLNVSGEKRELLEKFAAALMDREV